MNILDITIFIPYHILKTYHLRRKAAAECLLPGGYKKETGNTWTMLNNIMKSRKRLLTKSYDKNIPVFASIKQTLDYLINAYKTGENKFNT